MDGVEAVHGFVDVVKQFGNLLRQLNEKFYFYINIETYISWTVVFLIWVLYHLLIKYFIKEGEQLTSFKLIKLLGLYMLIMSAIIVSYTDFGRIMERSGPERSFIMILFMALLLIIGLAWVSEQPADLNKWIPWVLYVPIILLIISNGRILEERLDFFRGLLPRTDIEAVSLPGEIDELRVGGVVELKLIERLEEIVNSHKAVRESALVGHEDEDRFIKPYAFVVLTPASNPSDKLKKEILDHVSKIIRRNRITPDMYPYWIEFTDSGKLPRPGKGNAKQQKVEEILNKHRKVAESAVVTDAGKTTAYIVLEDGIPASRPLGRELLDFVLEGIKKHNQISPFLEPQWVEFIKKDRIPRTARGIDRITLQKKVKNWSVIFPSVPQRRAYE
ncbi:hypothetical protein QUF80_17855 [Desulfococcaceae bacterium HSG8]|nr:hypothetical protein [Desulfococcaceae bacterium HSG8]